MRAVKALLAGATGLFIIVTLLSLLIPAHPQVSRTILINAGRPAIMNQLTDLRQWKNWHPVFAADTATISFGKISSGQGATCDLVYNKKNIHLTITAMDTASVTIDMKADGENDITTRIYVTDVQPLQQSKADWVATTHLHWYPWEKFYAIFLDKLTGPGYETVLQSLKQYAEKK